MLINISTRKLYEEQINVNGIQKKSNAVVNPALLTIVSKIKHAGEPINVIRCDSERSSTTLDVQDYLIGENIALMPVKTFDGHSHHTALAIIDRAIRTIRDKATQRDVRKINKETNNIQQAVETYNFRLKKVGLTPEVVTKLVRKYNNTNHSFLTKLLGKPTTPNQVTHD
jgi:hypothetical protein